MKSRLGENGLRLRPGEIVNSADLDSYREFHDGWGTPRRSGGIWNRGVTFEGHR